MSSVLDAVLTTLISVIFLVPSDSFEMLVISLQAAPSSDSLFFC
jgi:hypothetical protein